MRIGFEAKRATHNFRGLGNYSRGIIEGLSKYFPNEEFFLYSPALKDPRAFEWVKTLSSNVHLRLPQKNVEKTFKEVWRRYLVKKDLIDDNLDIFHGLSHEIPYRLGECNFKRVVTIHDLIYLRYPEFFPTIDRVVYNHKFKHACQNADMVLAICEQTKFDLMQFLNVPEYKIQVHYQSCSPTFYDKRSPKEIEDFKSKYSISKPYILNVGAFEQRKNQLNLIDAFAMIANEVDAELILIGDGKDYKEQVKAKIQNINLENRIRILSGISHFDLPLFYQASNLFCFPSFFEGFGIPIVEALFSGVPVITSIGSCFPESAGENSIYIDPHSPTEIAQAIKTVLSNENLRMQMTNRGLDFVQKFHIKNSSEELIKLYQFIL
jgi:glycosyltransferase involved in cell wall biosynthesis